MNTLVMILRAISGCLEKLVDAIDDLGSKRLPEWRDAFARTHLGFGTPPPLSPTPEEARQYRRNDDKDAILWVSVGIIQVALWVMAFVVSTAFKFTSSRTKALELKKESRSSL